MSQHIDPVMTQSSVVDNLTTNDGTKALSAKQGKALSDQITTLNSNTAKKSSLGQARGSSVSTLEQLKEAILAIVNNTDSNSISAGTIDVSSTIADGLPNGTWGIIIEKSNNTYVGGIAYNNAYSPYSISKNADNWYFRKLTRGLATGRVTWAYSIPANGSVATNLKTLIDNSKPAGSEVLGIVGYTTNDVSVYANALSYKDGNYSGQLKNTSGSTQAHNCDIYYLYQIVN